MLLFKSVPGLGKQEGFFEILAAIIGREYCLITQQVERDVIGEFNGSIENKFLIVLDEINMTVAKRYEEEIKELITRQHDWINNKGKNKFISPSYSRVCSFSNREFPIPIRDGDRRMMPIDAYHHVRKDHAYITRLVSLKGKLSVLRLLYNYFLRVDLQDFDFVSGRPTTEYFKELMRVSQSFETQFIIEFIRKLDHDLQISTSDLFQQFIDFLFVNQTRENRYQTTSIKFGMTIKKMNISGLGKSRSENCRFYVFNVAECKKWVYEKFPELLDVNHDN
jgi:hypothetical protein